jgi:hypothetical protein
MGFLHELFHGQFGVGNYRQSGPPQKLAEFNSLALSADTSVSVGGAE